MNQYLSLRESLSDWTDVDFAGYRLAICLGIMSHDVNFATRAKHVFWAENGTGNGLHHILETLTQMSILEKRDEPDYQYRWNPNFKGSWE